MDVYSGELFRDLRYVLYSSDGVPTTYQGAWLAVDGGYQKAACFINPMHNRFAFPEVVFSEWLESVRKDVECAFGILKIRFRFLRNPVIYQDAEILSNAFKTACMLHNMLLEYDGLNETNWENIDPDNDIIEEDVVNNIVEQVPLNPIQNIIVPLRTLRTYIPYHSCQYDMIREALKDHFYYKYQKGDVLWPKNFSVKGKVHFL